MCSGPAVTRFAEQKSADERHGRLFIIGGGEDRRHDMSVLERYVELCGGPDGAIAVLTCASTVPDKMWQTYDAAFGDLGVRRRFPAAIQTRVQADDPERADVLRDVDGIFMSGGDQRRLVEILGGTRALEAIRFALHQRGACIGGTSAGASAMARCMLAHGTKEKLPDERTAQFEPGLGFLRNVVIDQHFSERQRLARLLSAIAQEPALIGVGVDEDTALIIEGDRHLDVIGKGAVTLLDGRHMTTNVAVAKRHENLELINVILHLLPSGNRYELRQDAVTSEGIRGSPALLDVLRRVSETPS